MSVVPGQRAQRRVHPLAQRAAQFARLLQRAARELHACRRAPAAPAAARPRPRSRRSSDSRRWSGGRPSARSAGRSPAPAPCRGRSAPIVSRPASARASTGPARRNPMRLESGVTFQVASKNARCAAASKCAWCRPSMAWITIGSRSGSVSAGADQLTVRRPAHVLLAVRFSISLAAKWRTHSRSAAGRRPRAARALPGRRTAPAGRCCGCRAPASSAMPPATAR